MKYINAVYYPAWEVYKEKTPSYLQVNRATHILYAFLLVNPDGSLRHSDNWADVEKLVDGEKGCIRALSKLKQEHPHLKTIVSVGGGNGSAEFPAVATSPKARERFAHAIRDFIDKHHFDGVDIDWEHPSSAKEGESYIKLLSALRTMLPKPRYLVTSALPAGVYCLRHIDLPAAAKILDFINLMGYDFTGSWTDVSGHHAQLHAPTGDLSHMDQTLKTCSSTGIEYLINERFPCQKIVLGIPLYARFFRGALGPGQRYSEAGEMDYCDIPGEWVCGAQTHGLTCAASWADRDGKGFVSFDVVSTVRQKANHVKERGLGGLFYWHGCGDRQGEESLVAAGQEELLKCNKA